MSPPERGTTRTLYLLRHAKSSWDDPALPDHERPLVERLKEKFPTAALATLELPSVWTGLGAAGATLADYVIPKRLR